MWQWFLELHAARSYGEKGLPQSITYTEIDAWSRLVRQPLLPWEVAVLREIDMAWMTGEKNGSSGQRKT